MTPSSLRSMDLSLRMGGERRIGQFPSLRLRLPTHMDDDFYTCLHFRTPSEGFSIHANHPITFSGDDTDAGVFHPLPLQGYTLLLYKDGDIKGFLRRERFSCIRTEGR